MSSVLARLHPVGVSLDQRLIDSDQLVYQVVHSFFAVLDVHSITSLQILCKDLL